MKQVYPILIEAIGDDYVVTVPDLDIGTQGSSLANAIEMAREAIEMWGCFELEQKRLIPAPTPITAHTAPEGVVLTLVDVDFEAYRRRHETRTIRKNVTIPAWLNEAAEEANINFSAALQDSLKAQLGVVDRK